MKKDVTKDTPVVMLTAGQLAAFLESQAAQKAGQGHDTDGKEELIKTGIDTTSSKFVFGYRGIRDHYSCGHNKACDLVNGILAPAVIRVGRKVIVNVEKADAILEQWTREHQPR